MYYAHDKSNNAIEYGMDYKGGHYTVTPYIGSKRQSNKTRTTISSLVDMTGITQDLLVRRIRRAIS